MITLSCIPMREPDILSKQILYSKVVNITGSGIRQTGLQILALLPTKWVTLGKLLVSVFLTAPNPYSTVVWNKRVNIRKAFCVCLARST